MWDPEPRPSKRRGNIAFSVLAGAVALGVALAAGRFALQGQSARIAVSSEARARLVNEMAVARLSQAVSSTAILCREDKMLCFWNQKLLDIDQSTFGFMDVVAGSGEGADRKPMTLLVKLCPPGFDSQENKVILNCGNENHAAVAEVELRFVSTQDLEASQLLAGGRAQGDEDSSAILATVKTEYQAGENIKRKFSSSVVIRRPRPMVRVVAEVGLCTPLCQVSMATGGVKSQHFCLSTPRIVNGLSVAGTARVNFRVYNDGPGYLYKFKVYRKLKPLAFNAARNDTEDFVFDSTRPETYRWCADNIDCNDEDPEGLSGTSSNLAAIGLPPGGSHAFQDSLNCYDDSLYSRPYNYYYSSSVANHYSASTSTVHADVRDHRFDGGAVWSRSSSVHTSVSTSWSSSVSTTFSQLALAARPSGSASYTFIPPERMDPKVEKEPWKYVAVEPRNALAANNGQSNINGTSTQQTDTVSVYRHDTINVYHHTTTVIMVNTGMN